MTKPRFLLHVCCAPCSTHVLELLSPSFEIIGAFFNPNIHPPREYALRLEGARRQLGESGAAVIYSVYDPAGWFASVAGHGNDPEGGERCALCIRMRLEETARLAAAGNFDEFGTTLTISPHKDARLINRLGAEAGEHHGIRFHEADFKKRDGYKKSCEISKRRGLYRQDYCGCIYSYMTRRNGKRRRA